MPSINAVPQEIPANLLDESGILPIHAVPKSPSNRIDGPVTDASGRTWLKVRVAAPPEDGKANRELLKFLAKQWKIPASALTLVSGDSSRYKRIRIEGMMKV